jgi:UDP-GlcNAc3NAcA epimerase
MRIASVVGTRPQLIKVAALQPALRARHEEIFIDTGQHYDPELADDLFVELGLPRPDHALGIAGGTHAAQLGRLLLALEPVLLATRPDAVLVYGDTNSTLAGAMAGVKLGIPVAHVEAGLRSFDRNMPEEINRVLVDHVARWCFAPTPASVANLRAEGIVDGVIEVGDVMQDLAAATAPAVRDPDVLTEIATRLASESPGITLRPGGFLYCTVHRADNRAPAALARIMDLLTALTGPEREAIVALHPGTRQAIADAGIAVPRHVRIIRPVGYRTSLALQLHCAAVLTDSGGIQREAYLLGAPCLILRSATEWVEAAGDVAGRSVIVGLDALAALRAMERLAPRGESGTLAARRAADLAVPPAGAAEAISASLADVWLNRRPSRGPPIRRSASKNLPDSHEKGEMRDPAG